MLCHKVKKVDTHSKKEYYVKKEKKNKKKKGRVL
jgi:hypothetical protein